jgi:hypothetical protein
MNALYLLRQAQAASENANEGTAAVWFRLAAHLSRNAAPVRVGNVRGELRAVFAHNTRDFVVEGQDQEIIYHARLAPDTALGETAVGTVPVHIAINAVLLTNSRAGVFHTYWAAVQLSGSETYSSLIRKLLALLPDKFQDMHTKTWTYAEKLKRDQHART